MDKYIIRPQLSNEVLKFASKFCVLLKPCQVFFFEISEQFTTCCRHILKPQLNYWSDSSHEAIMDRLLSRGYWAWYSICRLAQRAQPDLLTRMEREYGRSPLGDFSTLRKSIFFSPSTSLSWGSYDRVKALLVRGAVLGNWIESWNWQMSVYFRRRRNNFSWSLGLWAHW